MVMSIYGHGFRALTGASPEATEAVIGMDNAISPPLAVFLHILDSASWFSFSLFPFLFFHYFLYPF